ncbi:MAG: DUF4245 family protein [Pseudolysinimonas sp.]|uniref:DUF4245 family protein n=1 Tax=Pseudolysinimonas sp. TaxID=2680009 RepID=UPI003263AD16
MSAPTSTEPAATAVSNAAQRRAARQANQTTFNLVLAVVASLGLVLFLVVVVVRPTVAPLTVDFRSVGAAAQSDVSDTLVIPDLPADWTANRAELVTGTTDGVVRWEIGFLTPGGAYIGLVQGVDANPSWLADQVANARSSGDIQLGGLDWAAYDRRDAPDPGNVAYALTTVSGSSTIVLRGTASDEEFAVLATAIAKGRP